MMPLRGADGAPAAAGDAIVVWEAVALASAALAPGGDARKNFVTFGGASVGITRCVVRDRRRAVFDPRCVVKINSDRQLTTGLICMCMY